MATYTNQVLVLDAGLPTKVNATDIIALAGGIESTPIGRNGNAAAGFFTSVESSSTATFGGQLNVTGNALFGDAFIDLGSGYTTVAGRATGLVLNYLPTSTATTSATGGFATTSTVITAGSGTFGPGDLIQVSGAQNPANNGIYEVASHVGTTLTIDTTPSLGFSKSAFIVSAGDTAAVVTKINIRSIFANTSGTLQTAAGATLAAYNASVTSLATGAPTQITDGTGTLSYNGSGALSTDAGTTGITLDGTAASRVQVTAGDLTLQTVTSGDLELLSAGTFNLSDGVGGIAADGSGNIALTVLTNSATAFAIEDTAGSPVSFLSIDSTTGAAFIRVGSSGAALILDATNGDASQLVIKSNVSAGTPAFQISDDAGTPNLYLAFQSTTGNIQILTGAPLIMSSSGGDTPIGQLIEAGGSFSAGGVLAVSGTSGTYQQADADGAGTLNNVIGVALSAGTLGNPATMATHGIANVTFTGNVATADIGSFVYLSTTAGQATLTPPSSVGSRVYKVGIVVFADGTSTAQVAVQPQFIADVT